MKNAFCLLKSCLCGTACLSCVHATIRISIRIPKSTKSFGVKWLLICLAQWPPPTLNRHVSLLSSEFFIICRFQLCAVLVFPYFR